jgi:hypothetical protein
MRLRYVITKLTTNLPSLVVVYKIEEKDITLLHVEEYENG